MRLPLPVEGFLLADPFVTAMTLLSTHGVYRGLLWSVGLLALTLVFGRVRGWIRPLPGDPPLAAQPQVGFFHSRYDGATVQRVESLAARRALYAA